MTMDWTSSQSEILMNPRHSSEDRACFSKILTFSHHLPAHVWIATSGSTATLPGQVKWVGLSKEALLHSALAVNRHLQSSPSDTWIHCLPDFHVGGLGIWARSTLSGAKVIDCKGPSVKWDPIAFYEAICAHQGTLTSLVPTQLFDLLSLGLHAPPSLRAAIIGGYRLSEPLAIKAKELGWPILPSYGSTECASQVATTDLGSPHLKILSHMQVRQTDQGRLSIKSDALFTCYALVHGKEVSFVDPKEEGWFHTEDMGHVEGGILRIEGRSGSVVKVAGENVSLTKLETLFENLKAQREVQDDLALIAFPDQRLGHAIHLAISALQLNRPVRELIEAFNVQVMPYERIRKVHLLPTPLPRSPLFKLLSRELIDQVHSTNPCAIDFP